MNYLNAFWVGGLICALCQVLIDKTKLTPARVLVSLVVLGVILQGLGWYQAVVDYAGAGATVPLLGFGYSLAKGVAKAVAENGLLGVIAHTVQQCVKLPPPGGFLRIAVRKEKLIDGNMIPGYKVIEHL